jgi:hypothetical protein
VSHFSHCAWCARKLRDAVFCPECGHAVCSWLCLDRHVLHHTGPEKQQHPSTPADPPDGVEQGAASGS